MINIYEEMLNNIKGFLDKEEGEHLYKIALEASKKGPCLEIGSYCGKSTLYLGLACKENDGILFSIDHHRGSEIQQLGQEYFDADLFDPKTQRLDSFGEFRKTLERASLEETVVPIVCCSHIAAKAWATPLSLVFIDGGHSYEDVFMDYKCWVPHIMPNGYLIFHDIFFNPEEGGQAPRQVYEKALNSGLFQKHSMVKTLGVLQRKV
ncbi:MAG: class I SAM-dependent methyltransferase [Deferribacterota bacterium]|nr:class I SAM-dependent methyltransferase [Deferribacterota bacterium]